LIRVRNHVDVVALGAADVDQRLEAEVGQCAQDLLRDDIAHGPRLAVPLAESVDRLVGEVLARLVDLPEPPIEPVAGRFGVPVYGATISSAGRARK
jgi:hypothetical protein